VGTRLAQQPRTRRGNQASIDSLRSLPSFSDYADEPKIIDSSNSKASRVETQSHDFELFAGPGTLRAEFRTHDWSSTSIGQPHLVELEITESSIMEGGSEVTRTLTLLQSHGIKILVDDFGTGYSSLSRLQRLDFDVLKVNQAFTSILAESEEGKVFFTAIVTMAHALGMRVVAEGVESLEQIRILKSLHCDEIQGYYISKPIPPGDEKPVLPKWFFPTME
jgi:hypothetical protein